MFINRNQNNRRAAGVSRHLSNLGTVRTANRRGLALLVVMVALSMSLVLTISFLRTRSTMLLLNQNSSYRDLALQAAHTGAAVALEHIQAPDWQGVDEMLKYQVQSNGLGTTSYEITYFPLTSTGQSQLPSDNAFQLVILSKGIWQSADSDDERVERFVQVVARLKPRVCDGSPDTDFGLADDVSPNPDDYDTIQSYAVFASRGSNSLVCDPGHRIEGDLWLAKRLRLFETPNWRDAVRDQVLEEIGTKYVVPGSPPAFRHPHPLAGSITFGTSPRRSQEGDLALAAIPWTQSQTTPQLSSPTPSQWDTYRLYEGGFEYNAVQLGWQVSDQVLEPTPDNPLGVFYRSGNIRLEDNVTIRGTLVASGEVTFDGNSISISGYNWRGDDGQAIVLGSGDWPRLPAIVAKRVSFEPDVRAVIDGAIVVQQTLTGAGGRFERMAGNSVDISGTATSQPLQQPLSLVQVASASSSLSVLPTETDELYSIWLEDTLNEAEDDSGDDGGHGRGRGRGGDGGNDGGNSSASSSVGVGCWHAIVNVDSANQQLTVVGEVTHSTPTTFRIRLNRQRYVDIRGPVCGQKVDIYHIPDWSLTSSQWEALFAAWESARQAAGQTPEEFPFIDWLADPANFSGQSYPYSQYGITLEPTFHLRHPHNAHYQWSPPLFRPYPGTSSDPEQAGYRWEVLSWREVSNPPQLPN